LALFLPSVLSWLVISKIRWELLSLPAPFLFVGVVTSFCVEREAFVRCGEDVVELLEEGGVGGKGKKKVRFVVIAQGVWAGVLAAAGFCALFLFLPQGNKF
jgi:hypothetical protein